jgi:hypothetical protein
VHLRTDDGVGDAKAPIGRDLDSPNGRRRHLNLDGMTPDQASFTQLSFRTVA